jgi:hypothetical protein
MMTFGFLEIEDTSNPKMHSEFDLHVSNPTKCLNHKRDEKRVEYRDATNDLKYR